MSTPFRRLLFPVTAAAGAIAAGIAVSEEPAAPPAAETASEADVPERVGVDEARRQAKLLQTTHEATLHVIHRRYFDADEKETIPAKALEDVFRIADDGTGRSTRWISVSTPAMNVDHTPRTGFEEAAAKVLDSGERSYEAVEGDTYHRAGAITLFASCLRCHESGLTKQITKERVAGFVVSIPIQQTKASP